jgi:hypothetical protein
MTRRDLLNKYFKISFNSLNDKSKRNDKDIVIATRYNE